MIPCEYNSVLCRHLVRHPELGKQVNETHPRTRCTNGATQRVGTENFWFLCDGCAKLPIFLFLRKRRPISDDDRKQYELKKERDKQRATTGV